MASLRLRLLLRDPVERLQRGLLLGLLLGRAAADPALLAVDERGAGEAAVVSRSLHLHDGVDDLLADSRQLLLQLGLVVHGVRGRILDLATERLHDRRLDGLEAALEEDRGERRLEQGREHVAVLRQPRELLRLRGGAALQQSLSQSELLGDERARTPRDDVGADLRQSPLRELWV